MDAKYFGPVRDALSSESTFRWAWRITGSYLSLGRMGVGGVLVRGHSVDVMVGTEDGVDKAVENVVEIRERSSGRGGWKRM